MGAIPPSSVVDADSHRWAAFSEIGARPLNEDRFGFREGTGGLAVWGVADGMGGHADGDVAATVSIDAFLESAAAQDTPEAAVRRGMSAARHAVATLRGANAGSQAPSSTLVGLAVKGRIGFVCHAGDSVLFQFRDGRLIYRTRDHNVRELKRSVSGLLPLSAVDDPDASTLTRSLGDPLQDDATDTVNKLDLRTNDLLLLCSDGVSQHIPAEDPGAWANATRDEAELLERARRTVADARQPRQDNYTAIAIQIGSVGVNFGQVRRHWPLMVALLAIVTTISLWNEKELFGPSAADPVVASPRNAVPTRGREKQTATQAETSPALGASVTTTPSDSEATTVHATQAPLKGSRNALPQVAAKHCRTVFERQEKCTMVQRTGTRCRRESLPLKFEGSWPAIERQNSLAEVEGACQMQVHEFATGEFEMQCDGSLGEVSAACSCEWDPESTHRQHCEAMASTRCLSIREVCEDIVVPRRRCRTVRVARQVCD